MKIQFLLAWRYLWGRKGRMVLTTLAVVFSVTLLFGLNSMLPAMMEAFRHSMVTVSGKVDISISSTSGNSFDQNVLEKIKDIEGISQSTGLLSKSINLPESMGGIVSQLTGSSTITITGIDVQTAQTVHNYTIQEGRFLNSEDQASAVIPQLLADKLEVKVGDIFTVPSTQGVANLKIVGILALAEGSSLDEILVPLTEAQTILNLPGQINTLDILVTSKADRKTVLSNILEVLGPGYKSGAVEVGDELSSALAMGESMLWVIGIMALAMSAFIIFNTFRTIVAERRRDLGMLRAIGASKNTVMGLILIESLLQGIIGTGLGLLLGYLLCSALLLGMNNFIMGMLRVSIGKPVITPANLIGSILLGVGFTVGSGYFPARSAMQVTPLEAMRPTVAAVEYRQNNRRAVWGLLLMAISIVGLVLGDLKIAGFSGLVFLTSLVLIAPVMVKPVSNICGKIISWIYPREGWLAQGNLSRQPSRASITASSLMIGLAICITLLAMIMSVEHGFVTYLDKSLGSDYLLMPPSMFLGGGNLGANPSLMEKIRAVDGVSGATSLRLSYAQNGDATLQVIGLDPVLYPQIAGLEFSQGDEQEAFRALADGPNIIVNGIFATANSIQVGDPLTLKTPQGEKIYTVVGVGFDYLNAKIATGYISQKNLESDFNNTTDILILVNRDPSSNEGELTAALKELVKEYPAFSLINFTEFKNQQLSYFKSIMSVFYVLIFMLAIPGLIAMANTMSINVIERTREIGMLRAVGSTQKQVRRMIFAESVLLSALGTLMGLLVGLFLSYLLVKAIGFIGFQTVFYFPTSGVLGSILVGFTFGILAAMVPARQAAKTVIVDALHYE